MMFTALKADDNIQFTSLFPARHCDYLIFMGEKRSTLKKKCLETEAVGFCYFAPYFNKANI